MYTYVHPLYTIYTPYTPNMPSKHPLNTPYTPVYTTLNNPLIRYWRDRYLQPFYDLEHKVRNNLLTP